ncbi:MAG: glycosyltransferase family 9 protein [Alphaproteobacteria bacterium]|nr:glycosyltransferase family 9 protein [Alphaproteobacteria bacterium]
MPHILFISSTRIGDAVLSSGALEYARALAPGAEVTIACGPLPAPLFRGEPDLKALHTFVNRGGLAHWFTLRNQLKGERYDIAIDLRGSLLTYMLAARRRFVFRKSALVRHKVEEATALMRARHVLHPRLRIDEQARRDARAAAPDGPILVLGPGASIVAKRWRADRFAAVARRLTGPGAPLAGAAISVLGGPEDAEIAAEICASLAADGVHAQSIAGALDLLACAALLERTTLFIGNDSGLMHIAAAVGAPTLGLFGPTDERLYGPWGDRARALRGRPYAELAAFGDPHDVDRTMMDDLTIDAVEAAAQALLRGGGLA